MTEIVDFNLTEQELEMYGLARQKRPRGRPRKEHQFVFRRDERRAYEGFRIEMDGMRRSNRRSEAERQAELDEELVDVERALAHRENRKDLSSESDDEEFLDDWFQGWEEKVSSKVDSCFDFLRVRAQNKKEMLQKKKKIPNTSESDRERRRYRKRSRSSSPEIRREKRQCAEKALKRIHKSTKYWC